MPGPAPKAHSLRRGKSPRTDTLATATRVLPRAGRPGDPPPWPLGTRPPKAVADVWANLWRLPQAVVWEEQGSERVVARYTRVLLAAERPKATGVHLQEVRQLEDRLGLSPMSMLRLRWSIGDVDEDTAQDGELEAVVASMADYFGDLYAEPQGHPEEEADPMGE